VRPVSSRCSARVAELQFFIDAIREMLGLEPIYQRHSRRVSDAERFYREPFQEVSARTPVRNSG